MTKTKKKEILKKWLKLKKAEEKAKKERVLLEEEIEKIYGDFEGKSKTFKEEDINLKINIKKNVSYKLDQKKWIEVRNQISDDLRPEKISFSLDLKGFEYLRENEKEIYKKVSNCVTIDKRKTSIKIEKL